MNFKTYRQFISEGWNGNLEDWMPVYHATNHKFKEDSILNSKLFHKDIPGWYESRPFEILLDAWREKNYPKVISRMDAVYVTENPNNKWFNEKSTKYLYECNLSKSDLKSALVADSMIITDLVDVFEQDYFYLKKEFNSEKDIIEQFKSTPKKYFNLINEKWANKYFSGNISGSSEDDLEILVDQVVIERTFDKNE